MQLLPLAMLLAQAVFQPDPALMTPQAPVDALVQALTLRAELLGARDPLARVRPNGTVLLETPNIRLDPDRLLGAGELAFHVRDGATVEHLGVMDAWLEEEPSGTWAVVVTLDDAGTRALANFSAGQVGQRVQARVDGVVVAEPMVVAPIADGRCELRNHFGRREAERVVAGLRLPWHARLVGP